MIFLAFYCIEENMRAFFIFLLLSGALFAETTPKDSLEKLMRGNQRYVNGQLDHPNREIFRREEVATGQEPFAAIICCSDSRVPPEIIFDVGLGDAFVVRVAGNVIGPLETESVLFAVDVLHAPLILVLGHSNCGAVRAAMQGGAAAKDIPQIAKKIAPAMKTIALKKEQGKVPMLDEVIKTNVEYVRDQLKTIPLFSHLIKENKLMILGGFYDLDDGKVSLLKN
jgi:carbonic anhydrase